MSSKLTTHYSEKEICLLREMGFTDELICSMSTRNRSVSYAKYKFVPEHNGIEIYFEIKPDEDIISQLSKNGWRWSNYKRCWYAKKNSNNLAFVRKLCNVDDGLRSAQEIIAEERDRLETEERNRLEYLAMMKAEFDKFEWKSEYEDYPLHRLERVYFNYEERKIKKILSNVPQKLLSRLKYSKWSSAELTVEKAKKLQLLGRDYLALIEEITSRTREKAERQFFAIYNELYVVKKETEKNDCRTEKICPKCGNRHFEKDTLCPNCFLYMDLDNQLKRIDLKLSSFWKNLSVMGENMRPIGVAQRFRKGMSNAIETDTNSFNEAEKSVMEYIDGFDVGILQKIQHHYAQISRRILTQNSMKEIVNNEQLFSVLVVCLKLSNNDLMVAQYIEELCLGKCEERWRTN